MSNNLKLRMLSGLGTTFLLFGAFAIGGTIHEVFVKGTLSLFSPFAIIGTIAGVILLVIGRHLEMNHRNLLLSNNESKENEETFDEEYSPLNSEDLEKYEQDDSFEN